MVFKTVLCDPTISVSAKAIYALLASYTGADDECWPSVATMAKCLGCGRTSVKNWLHELAGKGWLEVTYSKGHSTNRYKLVIPMASTALPVTPVWGIPVIPVTPTINNLTINNEVRTVSTPVPLTTTAVSVPPLYHKVEKAFLSKNGDKFTDYPREGAAIKQLIKRAEARDKEHAEELLGSMIRAFWKLKNSGDKFWSGHPFTPSTLNTVSLWDRVLETMRRDEIPADILKIVQEDKW